MSNALTHLDLIDMFFEEMVPGKFKNTRNNKMKTFQIMMYVRVEGKLNALLNSYGSSSEKGIAIFEPRSGISRPTVSFNIGGETHDDCLKGIRQELGHYMSQNEMMTIIARMVTLNKDKFALIISVGLAEKIYVPHYSGGLRLISEEEAEKIVVVPEGGKAPINRGCISMFEDGLSTLKKGFKLMNPALVGV